MPGKQFSNRRRRGLRWLPGDGPEPYEVEDWSAEVRAAGLDPAEVEVAVSARRRRGAATARASCPSAGASVEAQHYGSTQENVEAALAGLVDLMNPED